MVEQQTIKYAPQWNNMTVDNDPSKVAKIELTALIIAVNNRRDSVSLPPLTTKPKKGKSQTSSPPQGDNPTSSTTPHPEAFDTDSLSDNILKNTTIIDLHKGLEVITQLLKDIKNSVKDDPAINKKIEEASETFAKISTQTTKILSLVRSLNFSTLLSTVKNIQDHASKAQSSLAPSSSVTLTFSITDTPTNVEGENATHTATKEPPSHTEGETDANIQEKSKEPKQSIDTNIGVKFMINGKTYYLTEQEVQEYWDKEEKIKKAEKESRLIAISKTEVIKVICEEAKKIGIHLKEAISSKAGELFKKAYDIEHEILKRQHIKKVKKSLELRKQKHDSYMWTVSSRLKPEPITDIKIHPKTNPLVITVYKGTDGRNFDVYKPFLFGAFGIFELDNMRKIIPKKKNIVVKDLMNSLSRRKQKHMELEPEIRIPGLECNRTLPENVLFVNNMVIEEPEYGIFFIDEFGDQAFQRWNDIDKVGMEALVSYLVAASMVKSPENARFIIKLRKLIAKHPDFAFLTHINNNM
nr:hypothetical protein [Tanacetum cinerariifolium]